MITAKEATALRDDPNEDPVARILRHLEHSIKEAAPYRNSVSEIFRMTEKVKADVMNKLVAGGFDVIQYDCVEQDSRGRFYRLEVRWPAFLLDEPAPVKEAAPETPRQLTLTHIDLDKLEEAMIDFFMNTLGDQYFVSDSPAAAAAIRTVAWLEAKHAGETFPPR